MENLDEEPDIEVFTVDGAEALEQVKKNSKKPWWRWFIIGILVIAITGMGFSYWQKEKLRQESEIELIAQISAIDQEVTVIASQSGEKKIDRVTAQNQINEQSSQLDQVKEKITTEPSVLLADSKAKLISQIDSLASKIEKTQERVSGKEKLENLEPIYNLKMAKAEFRTQSASFVNGQAWFVDAEKKEAISLDLKSKSFTSISLKEGQTDHLFTTNNSTYYFQLSNIEQSNQNWNLSAYNQRSNSEQDNDSPNISWPKNEIGSPKAILAGDNNFYFLETGAQQIWRQKINPKTELEKKPKNWWQRDEEVKTQRQPELEKLTDTTIDNSIWLAQNDGIIFKLTGGETTKWQIKNLDEDLEGNLRIDTDYENDDGLLFVLAPAQSKVLLVNKKTGEVERELTSTVFQTAVDIFVDQKNNVFYIAQPEQIFEIQIAP